MHTAICAFDDKGRARDAVETLVLAGFPRDDLHIEHKYETPEGAEANDRWDGMEREVAMDPRRLASLGNFFASLFGKDRSDHADTYARHVKRGGYVVVVDSADQADADRARAMLSDMHAGDVTIVDRREQGALRDIVGLRGDGSGTAGMVERSREPSGLRYADKDRPL